MIVHVFVTLNSLTIGLEGRGIAIFTIENIHCNLELVYVIELIKKKLLQINHFHR